MATRAADSFDDIRVALEKMRESQIPKCPRAASKRLYDCLRESVCCPNDCPHKPEWIGPLMG